MLGRASQQEMQAMGLFMHIVPMIVQIEDAPVADLIQNIENTLFDLFSTHA